MGRIGLPEIIFVALIILLLFGAKKLPEIGSAIGKALKEFKKAGKEIDEELNKDDNENNDKRA